MNTIIIFWELNSVFKQVVVVVTDLVSLNSSFVSSAVFVIHSDINVDIS